MSSKTNDLAPMVMDMGHGASGPSGGSHGGSGSGGSPGGDPAGTQTQGEGQAQLEGQAQGQAQGEGQGQSQDQSSSSDNWNGNGNENGNGNLNVDLNGNGNGNLNLNGNGNLNLNGNENVDSNTNSNTNTTTTDVKVTVDATISDHTPTAPMIDMHDMNFGAGLNGIFFSMPDFGTQTLNGSGTNFHVDQINNLVNNGTVSDVSDGLTVYGGGGAAGAYDFCDPCAPPSSGGEGSSFNFTQNATANGAGIGDSTFTSASDHSPVSGAVTAATSLSQEAFTQHIVLGSNIQYNSMPTTIVGGDTFSDIAGGAVHH